MVLSGPVRPERARLAEAAPQSSFRQLTSDADLRAGTQEGTRVSGGSLTMARNWGRLSYAGRTWAWSRWTSAWVTPGQDFTRLVPSWNATTPGETWLLVQARVRSSAGVVQRLEDDGPLEQPQRVPALHDAPARPTGSPRSAPTPSRRRPA